MNTYKKAILLGLLMGVVGAIVVIALATMGCSSTVAMSAGLGLVVSSAGVLSSMNLQKTTGT